MQACESFIYSTYFYPRPPGGGRPASLLSKICPELISIHALRVEGDQFPEYEDLALLISIHALRVEGDRSCVRISDRLRNFYPRPPGGGRLTELFGPCGIGWISIHALRVEGDRNKYVTCTTEEYFYPRPPGGGRPEQLQARAGKYVISIHALRVEGDHDHAGREEHRADFYPRPPGGGRQNPIGYMSTHYNFYPRPPGGGRRVPVHVLRDHVEISIHALRVEGDQNQRALAIYDTHFYPRPPGGGRHPREPMAPRVCDFYPRPPGGGRRSGIGRRYQRFYISIHALRVEGDLCEECHNKMHPISIHALRVEGDEIDYVLNCMQRISIHALRVEGDTWENPVPVPGAVFLSTPSGWRATHVRPVRRRRAFISIHALRVEGDPV